MPRRVLFFGLPGSGKTVALVKEMLAALREGKIVYSNVKIVWFGDLFKHTKFTLFLNKVICTIFRILRPIFVKKYLNAYNKLEALKIRKSEVRFEHFNEQEIPSDNLTEIYKQTFLAEKQLKFYGLLQEIEENGLINEHWYPKENYVYQEDLETAILSIVEQVENDPSKEFVMAWDEGFVDLEHGAKPPRFITNFYNQSRKLNVDILVASQRPVAVYPSFRALCDYMVHCEKRWFNRFKLEMFFVSNSANALPDLSADEEGRYRDSQPYDSFNGRKEVFPFFDTFQSIGLLKLFNKDKK